MLFLTVAVAKAPFRPIHNDTFWNTVDGKPIYSQGGGIFRFVDTATGQERYYWYGVRYREAALYRQAPLKDLFPDNHFEAVTCYTSDNLVDWTEVGDVLTAAEVESHAAPTWVGRLGVAYVAEKGLYALFVQHGAGVLIATADRPTGPFRWYRHKDMSSLIGTPNTGDQTVFTDEDTRRSYLIYSYGRGRNRAYVSEIGVVGDSIDLVDCTQVYIGEGREGNCMFKYQGRYYLCASNLYGWNASLAYYLVADDIRGPYLPQNSMLVMEGCEADYAHVTQTGFFVTVRGTEQETVVYCGDRWSDFANNGHGYNQWVPLSFKDSRPVFNSLSSWELDAQTGRWRVGADNNYILNGSFEADRRIIPNPVKPRQDFLRGWKTTVIKGNQVGVDVPHSPRLNYATQADDRADVIGSHCLSISDSMPFERRVTQQVTSTPSVPLPSGRYVLRCKVRGGQQFSQLDLFVKADGKTYTQPIAPNSRWTTIELSDIPIHGGQAEVGFHVKGNAGAWCLIDDVELRSIQMNHHHLGVPSMTVQADGTRSEVLLDTGWCYRPMADATWTVKDKRVTLPHTWNARYTKGTEYNRETMVYTRKLTVGNDMLQGKRLFLRFEGVNSVADVFVNHRTVGQHKGGYTAFTMEITDYVKEGENTIEVWASNAFRTDVLPISGDFNVYGGIHRPVRLLITGRDCISPLYYGSSGVLVRQDRVTREQAELTVETHLSLTGGRQGLRLRTSIRDAKGRTVATAESPVSSVATLSQPLCISSPILWNGRKNPYLYAVCVQLLDGDAVIDEQTVMTGLRYFSVDAEKGFFLNGERYPLRGFNRHEDVDGKGSALSQEDHERDMQLITATGATMIRLSHYPQSEYFYRLADEQGMVLWSEIPLCGPGGYNYTGYVRNAEENARQVAQEMVYQNMNHPSVCFWGIFNEILTDDGRFRQWDDPVPFVRELHQLYKQTDPSRLTTFATCVPHTHYLGCSDLMAWNKYFRKPGNEQKVRDFFADAYKTRGGQPLGISEYGDAGSIKIHTDPRYDRQRDHAENYQLLTHEGYWHAIKDMDWLWCKTIWQFSDMQSSIRHEGDRNGMNDKGMVTYDRQTCKDIYYFYKAQWNPEPMVYITGRRFTNRQHGLTDVKVYTNQKDAILYVNGKKIAKQQADDIHRILFKDVQLAEGDNKIEVRSGKLNDECTWTLNAK